MSAAWRLTNRCGDRAWGVEHERQAASAPRWAASGVTWNKQSPRRVSRSLRPQVVNPWGAARTVRMAEHDDGAGWKSSSRGETAWKEARDRVASRNAEARKQGKQRRESYERTREAARREAAAKQHAELLRRRTP